MNFAKVRNRLARARGSIAVSRELLEGGGIRKLSVAQRLDVVESASQCKEATQLLKALVARLATKAAIALTRSEQEPKRRLTLSKVPRQLKSALALLNKNVRDLPTSSYDLRPSHEQRVVAAREMTQIRKDCQTIMRLITTVDAPLSPVQRQAVRSP
jgi:hypothetical protein